MRLYVSNESMLFVLCQTGLHLQLPRFDRPDAPRAVGQCCAEAQCFSSAWRDRFKITMGMLWGCYGRLSLFGFNRTCADLFMCHTHDVWLPRADSTAYLQRTSFGFVGPQGFESLSHYTIEMGVCQNPIGSERCLLLPKCTRH